MIKKALVLFCLGTNFSVFTVLAEDSEIQNTDKTQEAPSEEGAAAGAEKNIGNLNVDKITNNFGSMLGGAGKTVTNQAPDAKKTADNFGDGLEKSGDTVTKK